MKSIHAKAYDALLKHLKRSRKAAGVTQADLAERLGYPQSFVSKCESGERRLDLLEYLRITQALAIDYRDGIEEMERTLQPLSTVVRQSTSRYVVRRKPNAPGGPTAPIRRKSREKR